MGRSLISFDRDIVDEVVRRSDGKFTKQQVEWCMKASVSYIHHLARYTDNISIRIPFIGYVICNLREMRVRRDKIRRILSRKVIVIRMKGCLLSLIVWIRRLRR